MSKRRHKCYRDADKQLAKHHTRLVCNLFDNNQLLVETEVTERKRGRKAVAVIASHCPFCGEKVTSPEGEV